MDVRAGPPCYAKQAPGCQADPNRKSQYKFIPSNVRNERGFPEGACVCKSPLCRRFFNMAPEPKPPGRPRSGSKRPRESGDADPVQGLPVGSCRARPPIVERIYEFKQARCAVPPGTDAPLHVRHFPCLCDLCLQAHRHGLRAPHDR